ncbi:Probable tautomerase HP_0924 [Cedecea neteri]|uniref:Probable tautomerase HP_0924 n=1 Tax=Cedecea neteri TaxID=158822 RepID=A0A2X3J182_9ENTR|nr:Probable tautomerase HP_0924 [Cedecea neteri]
MPYVNIRVTREGVSAEQKLALIEGVTDLLEQVLNKKTCRHLCGYRRS